MVIDIVSYTAAQLTAMKPANRQKILTAQLKKNALLQKLKEDILELQRTLIDRGVFSSTVFDLKKAELTTACNTEVDELKSALLFSLGNALNSDSTDSDGEDSGGNSGGDDGGDDNSGDSGGDSSGDTSSTPPYSVDYALSEEDRMAVVKEYYETTYSDATERFTAFSNDTFAREYLGEMYAPLYHYFEDFTL